jgi:N-carbamoyl-L-amino-acid hydrolase
MTTTPAIDARRLWQDLMTLGTLGATPLGGSNRLALTESDRDARNLFALWCAEAGLAVLVDPVGNMFARREGLDPSLPPVLVGSHLDTQTPGGQFDGPLGVLAGLAAIRAIDAAGIKPRRAIEVVNWTCEEGPRFGRGIVGSGVYAGSIPLEAAYALTDRQGLTFGAELARIRYRGEAALAGRTLDSYIELHIEQGPELERAGIGIGVVTHSHYSASATVEFLGENGHTSGQPMRERRNALVGAARAIAAIDDIGQVWGAEGSASVTVLDCWPNNRISVAHQAVFNIALVHPTQAGITAMRQEVDVALAQVSAKTGLAFRKFDESERGAVQFDPALTDLAEREAIAAGYSVQRMPSRAGHDAFSLIPVCPSQLIFVPCRGGVSHSELEWCEPAHCESGATVLLRMILARI